MDIRIMNETVGQETRKEQGSTVNEEKTMETEANIVVREKTGTDGRGTDIENKNTYSRHDAYISSEKNLSDATGVYSVSRKPGGGIEIKFDDIQLQKKRNDIKQEIMRLGTSKKPDDIEKTEKLKVKLASIEKKIRLEKQKRNGR